jgi:hypothetical protein
MQIFDLCVSCGPRNAYDTFISDIACMGSYFIDEITANTALQMYNKSDLWFRKYGHYKHCSQTSPVFNASFPELTCQENSGQEPCQKQGG